MRIRTVSSIVTLAMLSLFCTGCPGKKKDITAEPAADRDKPNKDDEAEDEEGERKGDAEKKDEGGW